MWTCMAGRLRKVMLPMNLVPVKLHLEYSHFWTPQCRRDFDKLQERTGAQNRDWENCFSSDWRKGARWKTLAMSTGHFGLLWRRWN